MKCQPRPISQLTNTHCIGWFMLMIDYLPWNPAPNGRDGAAYDNAGFGAGNDAPLTRPDNRRNDDDKKHFIGISAIADDH